MIHNASEVLVEYIEEIALARDIKQKLIVVEISSFEGNCWVKVPLYFMNTVLQSGKSLITDFS